MSRPIATRWLAEQNAAGVPWPAVLDGNGGVARLPRRGGMRTGLVLLPVSHARVQHRASEQTLIYINDVIIPPP